MAPANMHGVRSTTTSRWLCGLTDGQQCPFTFRVSLAKLDRMPGSDIPVIRQPFQDGDMLPFWAGTDAVVNSNFLFDLSNDPNEQENRAGEASEQALIDMLRSALDEVSAPTEQYLRLGLS